MTVTVSPLDVAADSLEPFAGLLWDDADRVDVAAPISPRRGSRGLIVLAATVAVAALIFGYLGVTSPKSPGKAATHRSTVVPANKPQPPLVRAAQPRTASASKPKTATRVRRHTSVAEVLSIRSAPKPVHVKLVKPIKRIVPIPPVQPIKRIVPIRPIPVEPVPPPPWKHPH